MTFFSKIKNHYLTYTLIAAILFNIGFYIYQINDLTKNVYLSREYTEKFQKMAGVNHQLASKAFQGDSWTILEEQIKKYNFEKVDSSKYVTVTGNSVVKAE